MRITKVYTRRGDSGQTTIGYGQHISKAAERIAAIGDIDELNAFIGLITTWFKTRTDDPECVRLLEILIAIQHDLFNIGGELSLPGEDCSKWMSIVDQKSLDYLEKLIDHIQAQLKPLKEFTLPGGTHLNSLCHCARTVCRRAERTLTTLNTKEQVRSDILAYVNRLSDFLFVLCRVATKLDKGDELLWEKTKGLKHLALS